FLSTKSCLIGCSCTAHSFVVTIHNLALRGRATQSSVYPAGIPMNAIDGNRASNWYQGSCSHTQYNFSPWWRLDLLKTYKVDSVSITNRDILPERINGIEIRIGNSLDNNGNNNPRCAVVSHIVGGGTETFQCNGMEGRYVNVVVPGRREYLTLCEVEFTMASMSSDTELKKREVLKRDHTSTQSSIRGAPWTGYSAASHTIDGNRGSQFIAGSCSTTEYQTNPWWRVDLLDSYIITSIIITVRGDCCADETIGANIYISDSPIQDQSPKKVSLGESFTLNFTSKVEGRYVTVKMEGQNKVLSLCEVEVYGYPAATGESLSCDMF
uniref:Fucolectin tachylectin-4 pentraxin-1 domain-containing protein n=1 Tax=Myripristis murdjan TaxID=586833 RepID=A0A667XKE0_9TELE